MATDSLSTVFGALADPTRRAILVRLAEGEASVGELARPFALSLPTVSRHIDVLEAVGLVVRERQAQRRVCRLQGEPLMQAGEWIARYAAFWEGRLDALERLVKDLDERSSNGSGGMLETKNEVLRLERWLAAPRRLVFAAVTQAGLIERWMCPGDYRSEAETDPVVGGRFRLAMHGPEGDVRRVEGTYREVLPPERVAFGWTWLEDPGMARVETLVTIELEESGRGTRLVLTHERLRDAAERELHRDGWTGALAKLERLMEETD